MLRKLTIENFFSIRDAQTIDFTIPKSTPDPDGRFALPIPDMDERIPRVVVIFGANASGKTNALKSLPFLKSFVQESVDYKPDSIIPFLNFFSNENREKNSRFYVEFDAEIFEHDTHRSKYAYELIISSNAKFVISEQLWHYPKGRKNSLFKRRLQNIDFKKFNITKSDPIREKVRPNASVISTLAKFNHPIALSFYNTLGGLFSDVSTTGKFKLSQNTATEYYSENDDLLNSLKTEIKRFDFGISDITIKQDGEQLKPVFEHNGIDFTFSYAFESQGTQNFYNLYPFIHYTLKSGGIAVLDELGSDIHPLLLPEIIKMFQDSETNPLDAQLIMSCHNATLLEYLSKEEIYFTEKTHDGATEIYGLKSMKGVRRDLNLYANYLSGVFGGTPNIG